MIDHTLPIDPLADTDTTGDNCTGAASNELPPPLSAPSIQSYAELLAQFHEDVEIQPGSTLLPEDASLRADASEEAFTTIDDTTSEEQESTELCIHGVRTTATGQVTFFSYSKTLRIASKVLIKQEHGVVLGEVVCHLDAHSASANNAIAGEITRPATAQDIANDTENRILAAEASAFCKTCIRQRDLEMKLVDVEVLHDRSKIIFFFTAPSRIDFRELVKDLVRTYRTRIELRQIGVRHETQMIGGLGNCGMVCCCHRYLRKFAPVTIKMAKEQNLFLNPAKLSGMCGRLLCCLSFEQQSYEEFNHRCPKLGKRYQTSSGVIKVMRANMFKQTIQGLTDANVEVEYSLEDWESLSPKRIDSHADPKHMTSELMEINQEDLKLLKGMEDTNDDIEPVKNNAPAPAPAPRHPRKKRRPH